MYYALGVQVSVLKSPISGFKSLPLATVLWHLSTLLRPRFIHLFPCGGAQKHLRRTYVNFGPARVAPSSDLCQSVFPEFELQELNALFD